MGQDASHEVRHVPWRWSQDSVAVARTIHRYVTTDLAASWQEMAMLTHRQIAGGGSRGPGYTLLSVHLALRGDGSGILTGIGLLTSSLCSCSPGPR